MYQILNFLAQGLNKLEYKKIKSKFIMFVFSFYFFNAIIIHILLPLFWTEIELFNIETLYVSYINIEYEPNLQQYITFLYKNIIIFNIIFLFQYVYCYIIQNLYILQYLKIKQYEKTFIFFISFSLFFLHSDVSQASLFCLIIISYFFIISKILKFYLLLKYKKQKQIINL